MSVRAHQVPSRIPPRREAGSCLAIAVRPWGERSFYIQDPWDNPLCFVEYGTVYSGSATTRGARLGPGRRAH